MRIKSKNVVLRNGQNLELRSPGSSDAKNFLRHLSISHAQSYKNLNNTSTYWSNFSVSEEEKILADFESSNVKFMMAAFHEQVIVGGLGFFGAMGDFVKHNGRIGMSIQREYCNLGLGTQMMSYCLASAKRLGFHRVELTVRTYNLGGIALYEKAGFQRVGLLKDAAKIDGEYVDEYFYQLLLE